MRNQAPWDKLRVVAAALRYRQTWRLPLRVQREMTNALSLVRPVRTSAGIFTHPYAPPIGGKAYGRYLCGLARMARGERVPLVAHLSVTDRCPCDCLRCSNLGRAEQDPSLAQLIRVVQSLRAAGTARIALTGGEPALRQDLTQLIEACGPELSVQLFTSGQGVEPGKARAWRDSGLDAAFVSLDHYRAEEHDAGRRRAGAFQSAVRAIQAFAEAGVHTTAQAVVGKALLAEGEMDKYLRLCRAVGAHEVMLLEPVAVRGAGSCEVLTEQDRRRLVALHRSSASDPSMLKVMSMTLLEGAEFLGCQAGVTFLYVSTQGEVFPCDFAPMSFGNAFAEPIEQVLGRMARLIPRASCRCMATSVPGSPCGQAVGWEATQRLLESYEPGEGPSLMRWCERQVAHGR
ncbi:MAG: radical SAM protein [Deltaproteobacteria bacterium]|nr:radical SAM protein [Deltaproteobacteria bacterium]